MDGLAREYGRCYEALVGAAEDWRERYRRLRGEHDGRAYHNWEHVRQAVGVGMALADDAGLSREDQARVVFALFNHDRVYDPRRSDNEERSAEAAYRDLADDEIGRLIRLTQTHDPSAGDALGGIVVDADLAILGSSEFDYRRYAAAIRLEYGWLDEPTYREGRAAVLRRLLRRAEEGALYRSARLDARQAARNLSAELAVPPTG